MKIKDCISEHIRIPLIVPVVFKFADNIFAIIMEVAGGDTLRQMMLKTTDMDTKIATKKILFGDTTDKSKGLMQEVTFYI